MCNVSKKLTSRYSYILLTYSYNNNKCSLLIKVQGTNTFNDTSGNKECKLIISNNNNNVEEE